MSQQQTKFGLKQVNNATPKWAQITFNIVVALAATGHAGQCRSTVDPRSGAVTAGPAVPELTFILDVPAQPARLAPRPPGAGAADRFEAESVEFHERPVRHIEHWP